MPVHKALSNFRIRDKFRFGKVTHSMAIVANSIAKKGPGTTVYNGPNSDAGNTTCMSRAELHGASDIDVLQRSNQRWLEPQTFSRGAAMRTAETGTQEGLATNARINAAAPKAKRGNEEAGENRQGNESSSPRAPGRNLEEGSGQGGSPQPEQR